MRRDAVHFLIPITPLPSGDMANVWNPPPSAVGHAEGKDANHGLRLAFQHRREDVCGIGSSDDATSRKHRTGRLPAAIANDGIVMP